MKRPALIALLTVALGLSAACSNVTYDQNHNFAEHSTWSWKPLAEDELEYRSASVTKALTESFTKKGYQYVADPAEADFLVAVNVTGSLSLNSPPTPHHSATGYPPQPASASMGVKTSYVMEAFVQESDQPFWSNSLVNDKLTPEQAIRWLNKFPSKES